MLRAGRLPEGVRSLAVQAVVKLRKWRQQAIRDELKYPRGNLLECVENNAYGYAYRFEEVFRRGNGACGLQVMFPSKGVKFII